MKCANREKENKKDRDKKVEKNLYYVVTILGWTRSLRIKRSIKSVLLSCTIPNIYDSL